MISRRSVIHAVCSCVLAVMFSAVLCAQWPNYPTRAVPKTPDGKPDLSGPVPRMPDGKPDFTGLWEARGGLGPPGGQRGGGQRGGLPGGGPPSGGPPPPPPAPLANDGPPLA